MKFWTFRNSLVKSLRLGPQGQAGRSQTKMSRRTFQAEEHREGLQVKLP
jgi:hypothetical protein